MEKKQIDDLTASLAHFIPDLPKKSNYGAVIVETRQFYGLAQIIKNHLFFLGKEWGLTVFHGGDNDYYLKKIMGGWKNVGFVNIHNRASFSSDDYNRLLTNPYFWQEMPYEKVLIFQCDSLLRKKGIEAFLQWDYVGAPWKFQHHGGNGGLSLRSSQTMHEICFDKIWNTSCGNEDVFFCNYMKEHGLNLAPREVCAQFSAESIYSPDPLGIHAADKYLPADQLKKLTETISYA